MALHPVCFFTSRLEAIWGFLSGNLTHVSSGSPSNVAVAPLASLMFWNILGTPLTQSCPLAQARLNTPRRHRGARTPPVTRVRHRGALTSCSPSVPSPPGAICLPGDVSRDTLIDCHDWGGGRCWPPVGGRKRGCCWTPCAARMAPVTAPSAQTSVAHRGEASGSGVGRGLGLVPAGSQHPEQRQARV